MMRRMRFPETRIPLLLLIAASSAMLACRRHGAADAGGGIEPAITRTQLAAPRVTATSTSFDLVSLPTGAVLVWGRPSRLGGGVSVLKLDAWGGVSGSEVVAYEPRLPSSGNSAERIAEDALEIDASSSRGSIAVVWVARNQLELSVKSSVGDIGSMRFGAPVLLGSTHRTITSGRGWVSIAAREDGRFQAAVRLGDGPCTDGSAGPCSAVDMASIRATEVEPVGVPLSVPTPCPELVVGTAWVGPRFHYGICSARTGAPLTTAYTIETDVSIARSDDVLPGCQADGFFASGDEVLLPGRCPGGRAGARMGARAHGMRALPMDAVTVRCEGRTPIVQTSASLGATVRLVAPVDHLETVLPENVAPRGSRAVWTGSTVLVAIPGSGEVGLHRWGCDQGQFIATDFM